jgi:hypothetical protein
VAELISRVEKGGIDEDDLESIMAAIGISF